MNQIDKNERIKNYNEVFKTLITPVSFLLTLTYSSIFFLRDSGIITELPPWTFSFIILVVILFLFSVSFWVQSRTSNLGYSEESLVTLQKQEKLDLTKNSVIILYVIVLLIPIPIFGITGEKIMLGGIYFWGFT